MARKNTTGSELVKGKHKSGGVLIWFNPLLIGLITIVI